jgi:predicted aspartyl protease
MGFSNIDSSCDLCIVDGELNGKKTYFLIDTGAGLTTLDENQSKSYSFIVTDRKIMEVGGFANNSGTVSEALGVKSIRINDIEIIETTVYTTDMEKLVKFIEDCTQKRISGIIGVPVLKRHRLVIDMSSNKLYRSSTR